MTPAEAAKTYKRHRKFFDDPKVKARRRELEAAEKTLKAYFREKPKLDHYQRIGCSRSPYTYFDTPAARAALGAKAAEFEEERERLTLSLLT